jgi:cytochrome oxidase Cu insertion factor (SCO1/SenC/PrrC family)
MIAIRILRIIRWTALVLIVLLVSGVAFFEFGRSEHQHQRASSDEAAGAIAVPEGVAIGGPFSLVDNKGHTVTDADFRGRWMLVFFGYTNCPDECPLTLHKMATALGGLGTLADQVAPLFISVDPTRDTPSRLTDYLSNFDMRITGLTGSDEQIAAVATAYRVYYAPGEHEQSGGDLVSHSTFLYLMDTSGRLNAVFLQDIDAEKLAGALRAKLAPLRRMTRPS